MIALACISAAGVGEGVGVGVGEGEGEGEGCLTRLRRFLIGETREFKQVAIAAFPCDAADLCPGKALAKVLDACTHASSRSCASLATT